MEGSLFRRKPKEQKEKNAKIEPVLVVRDHVQLRFSSLPMPNTRRSIDAHVQLGANRPFFPPPSFLCFRSIRSESSEYFHRLHPHAKPWASFLPAIHSQSQCALARDRFVSRVITMMMMMMVMVMMIKQALQVESNGRKTLLETNSRLKNNTS
jgi:hypothetical protein